jgi:hypothetical protein
LAIAASEVRMRKDLSGKLAEMLPGKKVARYLLLENRVRAKLRYELAAEIPLVASFILHLFLSIEPEKSGRSGDFPGFFISVPSHPPDIRLTYYL